MRIAACNVLGIAETAITAYIQHIMMMVDIVRELL